MNASGLHWDGVKTSAFGNTPMRIGHDFHKSTLFSDDALAKLIENSERENYYVNTMDVTAHDVSTRREGETGDLSGAEALEAVRKGHIWYLLMSPETIDPAYQDLVDEVYEDMARHIPGFRAHAAKMSILVSSPKVQVYYHCDVPGQTLWQVRGTKRVYVYPNKAPFLPQPSLERILLKQAHEISLDYDPSFDEQAVVFDLEPGEMAHWPLNAPHRIVNHDCVNVSFTTEHSTAETRRSYIVNVANGVLRNYLGLQHLSQRTDSSAYWLKYAVAGAYKTLHGKDKRQKSYTVDFRVDPTAPKSVRSISAHEFTR